MPRKNVISPEEGAELQRLYAELPEAQKRVLAAIKTSPPSHELTAELGELRRGLGGSIRLSIGDGGEDLEECRKVNPLAPFIGRPVSTTLLTIGVALARFFAFMRLPVAPLPQVDYPTITVSASMPGASPATMAATVATPLERHLGIIADVTGMSSESTVGITRITLQFGLNRSLNGAARDVQAAINAARADLPTNLRQNPSYYKVNPAAAPVAILAMTSETLTRGQIYDAASKVVQQALSQIEGVGQVQIGGSSLPAVRVEVNPLALFKYGIGLEDVRAALTSANAHSPRAPSRMAIAAACRSTPTTRRTMPRTIGRS